MIPFRVTAAAHNANASPSVTLEKGNHRLRAPRTSRPSLPSSMNGGTRLRNVAQNQTRRNLALLIILLVLAVLFCFGAAYHLYSMRWGTRYMDEPTFVTEHFQVHERTCSSDESRALASEKYMTYLPHSGFHNQRIALENALVLSILLNRTLVIPPIRLGKKPISYVNFESLSTSLVLSGKEGLQHCARIPSYMVLPSECLDYFDYTHMHWDWLAKYIRRGRPQIYQRTVSPHWIRDRLQLRDTEIFSLSDESRYHYQYHDIPSRLDNKFIKQILIPDLARSEQRLLQFGTLFGSSRLLLRSPDNIAVRSAIRRSMVFSNPSLVSVVDTIRNLIGASYLGAHIRVSDGHFEHNFAFNMREIWRKLVQMSYVHNQSEGLESERSNRFSPRLPSTSCWGSPKDKDQRATDIPLFIATDADNLRGDALFTSFSMISRCIFFISDFAAQLEPLNHIRNEDNDLKLAPFLVPFLEAMILGHASEVVTTEGSTFGRFTEDVLWRVYHNQEIIERG